MRFFSKRNHRVELIAIIKDLRGFANLGRRFLRGAVQICDLVNSTCARLAQECKLQAPHDWLRATAMSALKKTTRRALGGKRYHFRVEIVAICLHEANAKGFLKGEPLECPFPPFRDKPKRGARAA